MNCSGVHTYDSAVAMHSVKNDQCKLKCSDADFNASLVIVPLLLA